MKKTKEITLLKSLKEIGIEGEKNILLHSSLLHIGLIDDHKLSETPQIFLNTLLAASNCETTVFVPTFNYDFPRTREADLRNQKTSLGSFPEWFRQQENVVRSGHPMFSICGFGPNAESICAPEEPEYIPFSKGSTLDKLIYEDALLILQGIGIEVATAIVQIEQLLNVKYRFQKPFFGKTTLTNGKLVEGEFYHYCFPINGEYREDYSNLQEHLIRENLLIKSNLNGRSIFSIKLKTLYKEIEKSLQKNPFYLLNKIPANYYIYKNGEELAYPL